MIRKAIRKLTAAPVFESDEHKTQRVHLLNSTLLISMVLTLCLIAGNLAGHAIPLAVSGINVVVFGACLVLRRWTLQGRIGRAGGGLLAIGFAGVTLAIALIGTVRAPTTGVYMLLVIAAGLLFDRRGMILMTVLSALALAGLIGAESAGWLPQPNYAVTITQWVTYTVLFVWAGSLTLSALQSVRRALARAEQEIAEHRQAREGLRTSEERWHTLIKASPDGIVLMSLDGVIQQVSDQAWRMFGYAGPEAVLGRHFLEFLDESYHQAALARIHEMLNGQFSGPAEYLIIGRDGTRTPVEINAEVLHDAAGAPTHIFFVERDITGRKRAEAALRDAHWRLESIIKGTHVGTWEWNVQTGETVFNEVWAQLSGYTLAELAPISIKTWETLAHPDDLQQSAELLAQHFAGALPDYDVECRMKHKDGHWVWIHDRGRVITRTSDGQPLMMFGTHTDITAHKQAEQRAFELALERERVGILTKFIQDASHEFRTPLMIMQTNLYLLERLEDGPKRGRKLAQIGEQVTGITRLVDLLVEMTRLDSGVPFTTAPTDLNQWINAEAGKLQSTVAAKGLTLHLALASDLPPVAADGNRLGRALQELLDNAVRFTPAGGNVTVRTAGDAEGVTVEVQDSGPGIPPEVLSHIFERFYRQDVAHTTPGFGLGLPITRAIVERHGGRLEAESQAGTGSTFRIRLLAIDEGRLTKDDS